MISRLKTPLPLAAPEPITLRNNEPDRSILTKQSVDSKAASTKLAVMLAFAAIYLIWGSTHLAIRYAIETMPPLAMSATRFLVAGGVMYVACRLRGIPAPTVREWRSALMLGGLFFIGAHGCTSVGEVTVQSNIAALMAATIPLWVTLFAWIKRGGSRPTRIEWLGLGLGLTGAALLAGQGIFENGLHLDPFGTGLLLAAPFMWSIGTVASKGATLPRSPFMSTAAQMLAGGVGLALVTVVTGEASNIDFERISTNSVLALLYLIVPGSMIAFLAYAWLLRTVSPSKVATYAFVNPPIAMFVGWLMADEIISSISIIAAVVMTLAVILVISRKKA